MLNCNCDDCEKECSGDYIYCVKCYDKLQEQINELQLIIDNLNIEISELENTNHLGE